MCEKPYKRERTVDKSSDGTSTSWEKQLESIVSQEDVVDKEAAHIATRRIPYCLAASGTVRSNRPTCRIMQAAKNLFSSTNSIGNIRDCKNLPTQ